MFNPGVWKDDSVLRHKGPSSTMNVQNKQNNDSVRTSRIFLYISLPSLHE